MKNTKYIEKVYRIMNYGMHFRNFTIAIVVILLLYTRFINLPWGLPYPFHPDERNMADAIVRLQCDNIASTECMNPHFFAYGQFPLYLSYILVQGTYLMQGKDLMNTTFIDAVIALRVISAIASVLTFLVLWKIVRISQPRQNQLVDICQSLMLIFAPFFIQFSHFGTTESLLMFFYSFLVYLSLLNIKQKMSLKVFVPVAALVFGLALGTKVSSALFIAVPLFALVVSAWKTKEWNDHIGAILKFGALSAIVFVLTSPHNFISFQEFISSMKYESDVGVGNALVFYTRQFDYSIPILFQLVKIMPYVLGYGVYILGVIGFFLFWKKIEYNLLRFAFFVFFLPSAFLYAKWTRFITPDFPILLLVAVLTLGDIYRYLSNLYEKKAKFLQVCLCVFTVLVILPGMAYISIYAQDDVRFVASRWMFAHMQSDAPIFSETANTVDLPIAPPNTNIYSYPFKINSFNFYEVDNDPSLPSAFETGVSEANYIQIPSRRVVMNHTCYQENVVFEKKNSLGYTPERCAELAKKYPLLNKYYDDLFSGQLGFQEVAKFTSYPRIELFGQTLIEFPDEQAEETWTVFDHPVIRVYKRI